MKESSPLQSKLLEILRNNNYESLEAYKDPESWQKMREPERELLGQLFVLKGEKDLKEGDSKALDLFDKASKIAGQSAKVFFLLGRAYAVSSGGSEKSLSTAVRCYNQSVGLDPYSFEAWVGLGSVLMQKGVLLNEESYFHQAVEKFQAAYALLSLPKKIIPSDAAQADFFWHWGKSLFLIAKFQNKTSEYQAALEKYHLAIGKGIQSAEFWKDYGDIPFEMAMLSEKEDLYLKAAECYQKAVKLKHDFFEGWLALSICYLNIFKINQTEQAYDFAEMSFESCGSLNDSSELFWQKWAELQFEWARLQENLDLLRASLDKFSKADALHPNDPALLCNWGEAEMLYGSLAEDFDFLKAAERKFIFALGEDEHNHEIWYLYGTCLNELGRYFNDELYYRQAIEKFQKGLSREKSSAQLWHGLALSYFAIAELKNDIPLLEKGIRFCIRAIDNGGADQSQCWNDWGVALIKLAEVTHDKKHLEMAIEKFERAINLCNSQSDDGEPLNVDPEIFYNYGCAWDFLGDFHEDTSYYEKAIHALSRALQVKPEHFSARYNLALAFAHLGELAMDVDCFYRAIEEFNVLLSQDSEDEMVWNEYGVTLLNLAHLIHDAALPDKSLNYFRQAEAKFFHAIGLGCSHSYYHLACLYVLTDNLDGAFHYLEKAEHHNVLPAFEEIIQDQWLEALKEMPRFIAFIDRLRPK